MNPEWSANAAAEPGGCRVSNQPTGVWLDRIAAINGSGRQDGPARPPRRGPVAAGGSPTVVQLVIYNLPGRDCSALASNGELGPTEIDKYKTQYIDPIASILGESKYAATCGSSPRSRSTRCPTWSPTPAAARPPRRSATP